MLLNKRLKPQIAREMNENNFPLKIQFALEEMQLWLFKSKSTDWHHFKFMATVLK